jgi:hypothetical protein
LNQKVADLSKLIDELNMRINHIDDRPSGPVSELRINVDTLRDEIRQLKERPVVVPSSQTVPPSWVNVAKTLSSAEGVVQLEKIPEQQLEFLNDINYHRKESERRAKNFLLYGLSESDNIADDNTAIDNVLKALNVNGRDLVFVRRLKKRANASQEQSGHARPVPVLVGFRNEGLRDHYLANSGALRQQYPSVFVGQDMSPETRHVYKQVVEQKKLKNAQEVEKNTRTRFTIKFRSGIPRLVEFKLNEGNPN